jgi:NAD(P)-dependent dehydrogenase (short-subunit alcohol dehydrogenase family)
MKYVSELFDLSKKTVILTGAAGRIGSNFCHVLSGAGANVALVDIDKDKNKELQKIISRKYKTSPASYGLDITKKVQVKRLIRSVLNKYGKIDILINNAHFVPRQHPQRDAPFEQYPLDLWNKTVETNLTAIVLLSQEVGKVMMKQGKGVIVNISSIYGMVGPDQRIYGNSRLNSPVSYAATKGGLVSLTRYMAAYWHRKNIRVNTLTLGGALDPKLHVNKKFVENYSQRTMIGRMARNDEYNGALLFLASDASSYMTGANLVVDGGWTAW